MTPKSYIANARMYAVTPAVEQLWNDLFTVVARLSGVPLQPVPYAWPADIEELWARPDLGLVFICGKPFRNAGAKHQPIAVPLPYQRPMQSDMAISCYCTRFLVRDDSPWYNLADCFKSSLNSTQSPRLGWTVSHSHSGYNAVRYTLLQHRANSLSSSLPPTLGPLHTPRRCIDALLAREAGMVPLDSYYYTLLEQHSPERLAGTRVLVDSPAAPMPFFAASPETPQHVCQRLQETLCGLAHPLLKVLALEGFAPVNADNYAVLDTWEAKSNAAGIVLGSPCESGL